jgi:16S rRNA (guanine527-N7)-methyltransferase
VSYLELLESELREFEIELNSRQKATLVAYCGELLRWNKKINLTGLNGVALVRRLVVEPLWIGMQLRPDGVLLDIGSGNGSPAIPLQVISRFRKCHLVEARSKRAAFLRHLTTTLKLNNVAVYRAVFEEIAPQLERPDWVTLQAVALTKELSALLGRISHSTTTVVWITSPAARTDIQATRTITIPITGTRVFLFHLYNESTEQTKGV